MIVNKRPALSHLINMLALHFEVVHPRRRWAGLDGDDSGDVCQPRANAFALPQLPRLDKVCSLCFNSPNHNMSQ